jgi:hypothetical protein
MGIMQLRQAKRNMIWTFLFALGICCVFTGMAVGQVDQGAINGVVKDSTGAVIQGALVTLTNTDTNFVLQGKTDSKGNYSFSPIKIGHYTVSATAPKFETTTQQNVTVNIQDRLNIALTLKPGSALETVTVTSAPPMLQSENASVGQVMSADTINATPLNGRNWVFIAQLTAGVAPAIAAGGAPGAGTGDFSANGQRTLQNNFILDGVDNNNDTDSMQNGESYNVRPPPDALAEFKLDTSNYSAEFGHSAGAVLNASIKSGTNRSTEICGSMSAITDSMLLTGTVQAASFPHTTRTSSEPPLGCPSSRTSSSTLATPKQIASPLPSPTQI